jgi:glycerol-3-phosphate acyltransferase PlsY
MALAFTAMILGAFLLGGIPFGYLVGRWRGVDIFQHGSGNIGATNVGRVLGRRFGILVFVLDFGKGALAVALAQGLQHRLEYPDSDLWQALAVWSGLAAFLGHMFPVYLRFRGGKGVATGAGVVALLLPLPALAAIAVWLAAVAAFRYVSLASMAAAAVLCGSYLILTPSPWASAHLILTLFCLAAAVLLFVRHRSNIVRLLKGNENRLRETTAMHYLARIIHGLALGLWFGSAVFFLLIAAPSLFNTFEGLTAREERPAWLPASPTFSRRDAEIDGSREQGSRLAGAAVEPLFADFFPLQALCGLLALITAVGWAITQTSRLQRWRVILLSVAFVGVLAGWFLERKVHDLRDPRNQATDAYLQDPSASNRDRMKSLRADFGAWHGASLGLAMLTLLLVAGGMAMVATLPQNGIKKEEGGDRLPPANEDAAHAMQS